MKSERVGQKILIFPSIRTNFWLFRIGLSVSDPFLPTPNFRVRTFHRIRPANLPPYFPGSWVKASRNGMRSTACRLKRHGDAGAASEKQASTSTDEPFPLSPYILQRYPVLKIGHRLRTGRTDDIRPLRGRGVLHKYGYLAILLNGQLPATRPVSRPLLRPVTGDPVHPSYSVFRSLSYTAPSPDPPVKCLHLLLQRVHLPRLRLPSPVSLLSHADPPSDI